MKGIVFNVLEAVVTKELGADTWDALVEAAGVEGAYTALGNYDDAQLLALVAAASKALGKTPDEIVRWFGRKAMPIFHERYPQLFTPHNSTLPFLLTLNDVIHPAVRKFYPGADVPDFDFTTVSDHEIHIGYRSKRHLCAFAEGLIEGAADHYGERAAVRQTQCMNRGDAKCVLVVQVSK
ncbi:MAG: heme NO-binding domain-containing protein [Thermoplasmatota archaeon]|nr:heme NO-binding domain-containing protein [Halobacteriales archaeon]